LLLLASRHIVFSEWCRAALLVKKRQLLAEIHGDSAAKALLQQEYGDLATGDLASLTSSSLPSVGGGGVGVGGSEDFKEGEVEEGTESRERKGGRGSGRGKGGKKIPSAVDQLSAINGLLMSSDPNNPNGGALSAVSLANDEESLKYLFFEDQNLTEREKDLIHRAYLAGVTNKSLAGSGGGSENGNGNKVKKRQKKRPQNISMVAQQQLAALQYEQHSQNGGSVQWDFNESTSASQAGGEFGFDLMGDGNVDFDMNNKGGGSPNAKESGGGGDVNLSTSLLNMSLDKDMTMDEMGLSLSDKSVLTKQMSSDAMQSLTFNNFGGVDVGGDKATITIKMNGTSNGKGSGVVINGNVRNNSANNANIISNTNVCAKSNIPNLAKGKKKRHAFGDREGVDVDDSSGSANLASMSPTANMLHTLNANFKEGLITEDQKEEQKRLLVNNDIMAKEKGSCGNSPGATGGKKAVPKATIQPNHVDPDLIDPDQSVDLSTDLAQFIGSPNIMWSLGSSSGHGHSPQKNTETTA